MAQGNASQPGGPKGPADDGKRFCDGRCGGVCFSDEKGGGLEEGGLEVDPDRRDADSFFMFFRCRFLVCFREAFVFSFG